MKENWQPEGCVVGNMKSIPGSSLLCRLQPQPGAWQQTPWPFFSPSDPPSSCLLPSRIDTPVASSQAALSVFLAAWHLANTVTHLHLQCFLKKQRLEPTNSSFHCLLEPSAGWEKPMGPHNPGHLGVYYFLHWSMSSAYGQARSQIWERQSDRQIDRQRRERMCVCVNLTILRTSYCFLFCLGNFANASLPPSISRRGPTLCLQLSLSREPLSGCFFFFFLKALCFVAPDHFTWWNAISPLTIAI